MAKRITAFAAADGTLFTDPSACATYEKTTLLAVGVGAALAALGFAGAYILKADDKDGETSVNLQDFLIQNSEVVIEAVSPVKAPRQPRQPKADKVVAGTGTPDVAGTLTAGLGAGVEGKSDIAPIVIKEEPAATPEVVVEAADPAAGNAAEAELEALLGTGEVTL